MNRRAFFSMVSGAAAALGLAACAPKKASASPVYFGMDLASGPDVTVVVTRSEIDFIEVWVKRTPDAKWEHLAARGWHSWRDGVPSRPIDIHAEMHKAHQVAHYRVGYRDITIG